MPRSLKVTDISDREILRAIYEEAGSGGWANMEEIAERFFSMRGEDRRRFAMRCTATRLAYMKRTLNVVMKRVMYDKENHTKYTQWALTKQGEQFLLGQLTDAQTRALTNVDEGKLIATAEVVLNRYSVVRLPVATMIRRQWQHAYGQRRR